VNGLVSAHGAPPEWGNIYSGDCPLIFRVVDPRSRAV
jgi:hypothetical protein